MLISGSLYATNGNGQKKFKSEYSAVHWSVWATLIPIGVGVYPGRSLQPYRGILAGVAGIFGPSAGHFYAHQWGRGLKTAGFRAAIGALGTLAFLSQVGRDPGELNTPTVYGIIIVAGCSIVSLAIYDIVTASSSARLYNERIGKTNSLYFVPRIDIKNREYGLTVVYCF